MKKLLISVVFGAVSLSPAATLGSPPSDCPDCPWSEITRELEGLSNSNPSTIESKFKELHPQFLSMLLREIKTAKSALPLWGESLNYDEGAKATIISPSIIDYFLGKFGATPRKDRVVHAGVEHTYGYLFTNLKTPFGFKRARWVLPDLEEGFGLKKGTLSPSVSDGGFFSNVTFFSGSIAFQGEKKNLATLAALSDVSPGLKNFDFSKLKVTRLEETIQIPGRIVVLRTDFVPFTHVKGANAEALIYSIRDFEAESPREGKLITIFPVAATFRNGALNPENLGSDKAIQTRYNGYVSGITGSTRHGVRKISP